VQVQVTNHRHDHSLVEKITFCRKRFLLISVHFEQNNFLNKYTVQNKEKKFAHKLEIKREPLRTAKHCSRTVDGQIKLRQK
jgi:hypothetical protein